MARNKLTPRIYTDVPRKNGEGTFYATLQTRYYGNDTERQQAENNIKEYYRQLFKGEVYFDKVITTFCIYDDVDDSCVYKKTSFQIIREMIDSNLRSKEEKFGDAAMMARIDPMLLHLDRYKTLNPDDYAMLLQRFDLFKLPIYTAFADKYLQSNKTPLIAITL